jgi:hypothetical protein
MPVFAAENRMGLGMVIPDHLGALKLSCSEGINGIISPELAEAYAIRRVTREQGFNHIILATDCLSIIQCILAEEHDRSTVGSVKAQL